MTHVTRVAHLPPMYLLANVHSTSLFEEPPPYREGAQHGFVYRFLYRSERGSSAGRPRMKPSVPTTLTRPEKMCPASSIGDKRSHCVFLPPVQTVFERRDGSRLFGGWPSNEPDDSSNGLAPQKGRVDFMLGIGLCKRADVVAHALPKCVSRLEVLPRRLWSEHRHHFIPMQLIANRRGMRCGRRNFEQRLHSGHHLLVLVLARAIHGEAREHVHARVVIDFTFVPTKIRPVQRREIETTAKCTSHIDLNGPVPANIAKYLAALSEETFLFQISLQEQCRVRASPLQGVLEPTVTQENG